MVWRFSILMVSALVLSACNKPGGEKASGPAEVAKPIVSPAALPTRKPGLWQQIVSTGGMNQESHICIDPTVEAKISVWGAQAGKKLCDTSQITPIPGGGWQFSSSCDMGTGGKIVSAGKITGDFTTNYMVATESTTQGAATPQMNGVHKMTLVGLWEGPCPADMKPGDMTLPGGMKMNLLDMTK